MAKTSAVQKNLKRIKLVKKYAKKRAALKKIINNRKLELAERFEAVPKNINELVNFSLIMFSGYISQKPVIAVLKTNPIFKIIFEKLKIFRLILLHKILKK